MSDYSLLDYDSADKSDKSSKSSSASPGTNHGKSPEPMHGNSRESEYGKSSESAHGKTPEEGRIKSLDKSHRKFPYKFLEKLAKRSDSLSRREEIEHYHSTKIDGTSSEEIKKENIYSKITGSDFEFSPEKNFFAKSVKDGRQQKSSGSGITPKIGHPGKPKRDGLKEREETVHDRLYNACIRGELNVVKDILRVHYTTLMPDEQGQTPLYAACIGNQPEIIEFLLEYGYVVDHQDNDGKTPLHIAFECDEPAVAKLLLKKYYANHKLRDVRNWTPLHCAIDHGYYDLSSRLSRDFLEEDANTEVSWIQLIVACYERKLETVKFLLATNADVNHVSSSGHTALHIACARNEAAIVKLLLQNGAQETMNLPATSRSLAAMHIACARNYVSMVKELLEYGADPNILCAKNKTPCHVAVATGNTETLQCLLRCPDVNINAVDRDGDTCLQNAVYRRNLKMVTLLLAHNADVNTLNHLCLSPLHAAIHVRDDVIAQKLLECNADPNLLDTDGDNCLQLALHTCRQDIVPMLLKAGVNVSASDKDGDSCLHLAIYKQCNAQTIQLLIEQGAPLEQQNNRGLTPLLLASRKGNQHAIQLLLNSGCDPNAADKDGVSVLQSAVHKDCNTETVQALIGHGAHLNYINMKGYTTLMIGCAQEHEDLVKLLLQNGADPDINDWEGDSPLHIACMKNDVAKAVLLLEHGANAESKNNAGHEPLWCAVRLNNPALLEAFFNHSPTLLDMIIDPQETALHYYCRKGRAGMVEWMLSHGEDKDKVCTKGSPVDLALSRGHKNIVFMLLDAGADVSMSPERQGFLGMIYQQRHLYMDILQYIVEKNCNVDFTIRDSANETLFFKACRDEAVDIAQMLLDSKHDIGINICNNEGQTPVAIICVNAAKPESEALTLLSMVVNSGRAVDVDAADHKKTTPLHLVCQENKVFMVNLILRKSRGSVNARDSMGRTPLQLAKTADVINLLVTFGADKD